VVNLLKEFEVFLNGKKTAYNYRT